MRKKRLSEYQRGVLGRFRKFLDLCSVLHEEMKFQGNHERLAVCLHCSIYENADSIATLLEASSYVPSKLILRSTIEALVDLRILAKDHSHLKAMDLVCKQERLRFCKASLNPRLANAAFSEEMFERVDPRTEKKELEEAIGKLKEEGVKALGTGWLFGKADALDWYYGVYWLLCQNSHNNLGALEGRHIETAEEEGQIAVCSPPSDERCARVAFTSGDLVVESLQALHTLHIVSADAVARARSASQAIQNGGK